jgi:hypothetical protein
MRRYEAIAGRRNGSRKIWMGESHIEPGMVSGDHHYGEAETGIYVVSGHPVFVFLEENPSPDEKAVVVLARSTQEGIVVNLPSLRADVPELDRIVAEAAAR